MSRSFYATRDDSYDSNRVARRAKLDVITAPTPGPASPRPFPRSAAPVACRQQPGFYPVTALLASVL